jgi:hypothetical protein
MSPRRTHVLFLCAVGVLGLVTGCASDPAFRARYAQQEHERLTRELQQVEQRLQAPSSYVEELRAPAKAGKSFSVYWSPASLEQMVRQLLPMRMAARNFHRDLEGEVIVENLSNVRFGPNNRLTCQVVMRGENIRYTGKVPKGYEGEIRKFQQGVAAGVVADMEAELSLEAPALVAKARAMQTRLKANSSSTAESTLRDQMNDRTLRSPFAFDLTLQGSPATPRRMVLTGNHLVVTYSP